MSKPVSLSNPADVTNDWLTQVLNKAEFDGTVTSFTAKSIGTGQVGENVRFTLSGTGNLPATVVGKFPSSDPVSRQTGIDTLSYKSELDFYQNLQKTLNIKTPKIMLAEFDEQTHNFVIVMEDLSPAVPGDQLAGCSVTDAELAIAQLAHLHGPRWGDQSLIDRILIKDQGKAVGSIKALYDMLSAAFLERYTASLNEDEKVMVQQVGENLVAYESGYQGKLTLVHADYRLDNMMFGGPYPIAIVDWQTYQMGCPMHDAAYFLGTSLTSDLRATSETALIQTYHQGLSQYDVDLDWDTCWHYYKHYAPAGLIMAVIASMIVGQTDRGDEMFMAMAKRSARMCADLSSIQVIQSGV